MPNNIHKKNPTLLNDNDSTGHDNVDPVNNKITVPGANEPGSPGSNEDLFVVPKPADINTIGRTASALIVDGPCVLKGFTIVSHVAGATVRFSDAITATTPYVSSAFTTIANHQAGDYIPVAKDGIKMATGCYVTIVGTIEIIPDVTTLL